MLKELFTRFRGENGYLKNSSARQVLVGNSPGFVKNASYAKSMGGRPCPTALRLG